MHNTITWTRVVEPRELYRIMYMDRDNQRTERIIELRKVGDVDGTIYFGVLHDGKFKTLRSDRIIAVTEQITKGHEASITPAPTYATTLPPFPLANAVYRMPTTAVSGRTWRVDLNLYTCTCPEKRIRFGKGYQPGQLGYVCPHMARAILDYLPADSGWTTSLLDFLRNPRKVHIDNLT